MIRLHTAAEADGELLAADGVCKRFGGRKVLEDVSLRVRRGRIVTLIGPNGAGKTTLIRIALGLMGADRGRVVRRPGMQVGYMPQRMALDPVLPLTVDRFLRLGPRRGGARYTRRAQRGAQTSQQAPQPRKAQEVLARLGIPHLTERQMLDISGGELQRVLLARALMGRPELLILDEPAQGVDLSGQAELYSLITELAAESGCGVLMISHDLHLVMSATDEVVCLNHHVCCQGKPEQVSSDPAFLDLFGAQVSKSLAVYTHRHSHVHDLAGEVVKGGGASNASSASDASSAPETSDERKGAS